MCGAGEGVWAVAGTSSNRACVHSESIQHLGGVRHDVDDASPRLTR
jgi:hypothetical protein